MQPAVLARLVRKGSRVALRRLTGSNGGKHPEGWSLRLEILVDGLRESMRDAARLSVRDRRALFESMAPPSFARDIRREHTNADGVPATWFIPRGAPVRAGSEVILYFHGGAYQFGSVKTYADWMNRLARGANRRVLAIDYRLAPEYPFPAAREDALTAVRFLSRAGHAIVLAGDSAGGNLTLTTLLAIRDGAGGDGVRMPARAVLVCPWLDLAFARPSRTENDGFDTIPKSAADAWAMAYLAGHDARDPRISPIYADLTGLPPLLIQAGTREVLRDEIVELDAKARAAGVNVTLSMYKGMVHDWHMLATFGVAESRDAILEMAKFLAG